MRRLILCLLLAAATAAVPAAAQTAEPVPPPAVAQTRATADEVPEYQTPASTGLPRREAPPRTLRAYWHLFGAFAITLLLLFGYAISIGRRFARLDAEVQRLKR